MTFDYAFVYFVVSKRIHKLQKTNRMKRNFVLVAAILTFVIFSCKKNDKVSEQAPGIIGLWKMDSQRVVEYNGAAIVRNEKDEFTNTTMEFKAANRFSFSYPGEPVEGGDYQYNVTDKTLALKYDSETEFDTGEVTELSAKRMVLRGTADYDPPMEGVTHEVTTIYFSR